MPTELEKKWMAAWRYAAPELERIRNEELQNLDDEKAIRLIQSSVNQPQESSGLAIFQAWMMRWRVIELTKELEKSR